MFYFIGTLKCYYDQNFMSQVKQKLVSWGLPDTVVPMYVVKIKFGSRKPKILSLEKWCFRVRH